jgi:large repetitive protein
MIYASLCKKTHRITPWFHSTKSRRMDKMRSHGIAALIFVAAAGSLSAQFTITTNSLPTGIVGEAYSAQLQTSGALSPVTWYICPPAANCIPGGSPAPGLTLDSSSGAITGTPTTTGDFGFTVQAEFDDSAPQQTTKSLSINVVTPCVPTVAPASLPQGDVNIPYAQVQFTTSGCPGSTFTFSAQSVNLFNPSILPQGLILTSLGILKGTPSITGTFSFLLTLTDQNQHLTQLQYSITINPPPTISTSSPLPNGPVGVPYSQQIVATGGTPPYVFSMSGNPPGITITESGLLGGTPTQAGTFSFNIGLEDSVHAQTVSPFQVTFAAAISELLVTPASLTFNASLNGGPPPTQALVIVPANGATPPVSFHVIVDAGQNNTPAPPWITVNVTSGVSPGGLVVSVDQGSMVAGAYAARIQIVDSNGFATAIPVTLNVASVTTQLMVAPAMLNFAALSATPGNLIENLLVSNSGPPSLAFTTSVVNNSPWISGITPASSVTTGNGPVILQVQVNTEGLQVGANTDAILVASSAGNVQIPVSVFVAASGSILAVENTGVLFQAVQGGGSTATQIVKILNVGAPSSTVVWNAKLVSGSNWLNLVSSSGTATTSTPGELTLALAPNATELTAGPYYAIVQITDSNSLNSPQFVAAVLNLQPSGTAPAPYVAPPGLFFTTTAGGTAPPAQQVEINTSSAGGVAFAAAVSTSGGGTWLNVTPASGNASGQTAGLVAVTVDPTGLAAGIYSGNVNVSIGSLLQSVNVTFVVQNNGSSSASSPSIGRFKPAATGCTPSKLAITETGLADNFAVPAGWPATLIAQLNDDCASPVTNGSVVASFSNGDAALNLVGDSLGNYSATWQPGAVSASLVVTLNATAGTLQPATAELYGGIAPNKTPPPTIAPGGTLNNLNPVVGAPLAPGTIAQVYGSALATALVSTGPAPLPTNFNNTFALVGSNAAPLYALSSGQIDIQIPLEATATQQIPIILSVNNALTLPQTLSIVPTTPGVLSADDGQTPPSVQNGAHIIAQHSANGTLVTSASPAKPGEYLVMYLVGMGATKPPVASGAETPTAPLSYATVQPTVTVGSATSNVLFAGLTPGFVGLYQIDFQVPPNASSGELVVTVTQNGVAANPTKLPVSN